MSRSISQNSAPHFAVQEYAQKPMNAEILLRNVEGGTAVEAPADFVGVTYATVRKVDGFFVMSGITGTHRLNAAGWATDAERLLAHWSGFKENCVRECMKRGFMRNLPCVEVAQ